MTPEQKKRIKDLEFLIENEKKLISMSQMTIDRWTSNIKSIYEEAGMPQMYIDGAMSLLKTPL